MATKNNENALKKKATPFSSSSSSSHPTHRPAAAATSPKPANANVKAVVASTSKSILSSGTARSSVPNYLKPTVSSRTNTDPSATLRYVRKSTLPHANTAMATTCRQSITAAPPNRRRSLDVPPSASSRSFKSLISPDSERPTSARERTTIRALSFTPRPNQNHSSSSSNRPAAGNLERNSKSFKPSIKSSYNPSPTTPTSNLKRTTSLTSRNTAPKNLQISLSENLTGDIDVTQILDIHGTTQEEDSNLIHIDTVKIESTSRKEEPVFYTPRTGIEQLNDTATEHGEVNNKEKEEVKPALDDKIDIISPNVSEAESEAQTLQVENPDYHESNEKEKEKEEERKIDEKQENDDTKGSQEIRGDDGNAADLIVDEKKEEEEGISGEINKSLWEEETVRVEENVREEEAKAEKEAEQEQKRDAVAGISGKKESPAAYNDVIEEAKNKLLAKNTSKVKALAGAFETVIDYESASNSKPPIYHHRTLL